MILIKQQDTGIPDAQQHHLGYQSQVWAMGNTDFSVLKIVIQGGILKSGENDIEQVTEFKGFWHPVMSLGRSESRSRRLDRGIQRFEQYQILENSDPWVGKICKTSDSIGSF